MSDQGPGGYGGGGYGGGAPPGGAPPGGQPPGGQGGWGQPPGAPPGGYGQPPGGYGPPPGGYGQPPGVPAGYPPQQGYGQPMPPAPGGPPKKSNAPLILGIGCGALLLLGGAGAAWFYFSVVRPAQEVARAVSELDGGLGATVSLSDAGVVVKLPGVGEITAAAPPPGATEAPTAATPGAAAPARPGTTPTASVPAVPSAVPTTNVNLTPGGPSCAAAAACCRAVLEKSGATAQVAQCDQLKTAPEVACAQALASQRQIAAAVGAKCP